LFIGWDRPAPLTAFLQPAQGGMDWRVPPTTTTSTATTMSQLWRDLEENPLLQQEQNQQQQQQPAKVVVQRAGNQNDIIQMSREGNITVLLVKFQSHDHGAIYYNDQILVQEQQQSPDNNNNNEPTFEQVLAPIWHVLFTPVPRIANQVQQSLSSFLLSSSRLPFDDFSDTCNNLAYSEVRAAKQAECYDYNNSKYGNGNSNANSASSASTSSLPFSLLWQTKSSTSSTAAAEATAAAAAACVRKKHCVQLATCSLTTKPDNVFSTSFPVPMPTNGRLRGSEKAVVVMVPAPTAAVMALRPLVRTIIRLDNLYSPWTIIG
jgi:hypothetical protein